MAANQAGVSIEDVSKTFVTRTGKQVDEVHVLDHVSLRVEPGEIVALTGLSGCGKTTLLRILLGLERADSGRVLVNGSEVTGCGADRSMVFQNAQLFPWRSALGNVEFGLEARGVPKSERRRTALEKLELVGLGHATDRRPDQLSGGMQQRVGLARALSVDPAVLLMDEPFGALDAQTREGLQAEVLRIHRETGKTIIFVTHDLDEAVLLAHRVVLMAPNPGRIDRIFPIELPAPRTDLVTVRGRKEFGAQRHEIWHRLMTGASAQAAAEPATT
ncbi:ATP-binding cassette domain-containing protein [Actinomadura sp. LD22]|uniref:ATP-binding cassette domain-containing protein n=1 Tax=Actinomadura physcomitrii TaxID=2650748 RepID=A0A6I4MJY4_9ACTN|nr:ABC transporter ATP-binding protein [Actinomadura physcomitrii]MWA02969.1 ATP-binding cassette domain-containing protein [Actinomadura physcomitrii]